MVVERLSQSQRLPSCTARPGYDAAMRLDIFNCSRRRRLLLSIAVALLFWLALVLLFRPSNERDWNDDQARAATAEIDGDQIRVHNLRNEG